MNSNSSRDLNLPDQATLMANLVELARGVDAVDRYLDANDTGYFSHPDGRRDPLEGLAFSPPQAALIAYLAQRCPTPLSIETGFGMGSSTAVILGSRRSVGHSFQHLAFDPFGLPDRRGAVVQSYLEAEFDEFCRCHERSEVGLGKLLSTQGCNSVGLALIDGGHHFETVISDFRLADLLCCDGGFIIFDDAWFPAIETAISYIRANRPDYALAHLAAPSTTVLQKRGPDQRHWGEFSPFPVPQRSNWRSVV